MTELEQDKKKREKVVTEELLMLERIRERHNWTFVGQEEADIAEKAGLDSEIPSGGTGCPEKERKPG